MKQHVTKYFVEWSEGKLTPAQQSAVESHLLACEACKRYYHTMSEWLDVVDDTALPTLQPDPFLPTRIAAIVSERQKTVVRFDVVQALRYAMTAAMLVLALGLGAFIGESIAEESTFATQTQSVISAENTLWGDSWIDTIENLNLSEAEEPNNAD
jgi:predicted anti-sigma-YlaC factor YlaD